MFDTVLLLAILIVSLYSLYQTPYRGPASRVYEDRTEMVQRVVVRSVDDLQDDMIFLWKLRCEGKSASRREVTRRKEMTAHRWNDANRRLERLNLVAGRDRYEEGVAVIRTYVQERKRLAATPTYVEPM